MLDMCMAASVLIGKKKKLKKHITVLIGIGLSLVLIFATVAIYLGIYYHADESAAVTSDEVQVESIDGGYFYD
ncbi:MAG: hypothetical protein MJ145_04510, partial [Clostridia bacterium]|nr:hypothetical protein [Clostridia bacterium]